MVGSDQMGAHCPLPCLYREIRVPRTVIGSYRDLSNMLADQSSHRECKAVFGLGMPDDIFERNNDMVTPAILGRTRDLLCRRKSLERPSDGRCHVRTFR